MLREVVMKRFELHFIVDILDIQYVLMVLNNYGYADSLYPTSLQIGNCGWAKAPNAYYVRVFVPKDKVNEIVDSMKDNGVNFLSESTTGL